MKRTKRMVGTLLGGLALGWSTTAAAQMPPAPPPPEGAAPVAPPPATGAPAMGAPDLGPGASASAPYDAAPKPPPYSLPWQLRALVPVTSFRNDLTFGFYKDPASSNKGVVAVESIFLSIKLADWVGVHARVTAAGNWAPAPGAPAMSMPGMAAKPPVMSDGTLANPVFSILFSAKAGDFRIAPALALVLPLGMGGGDPVEPGPDAANKVAVRARSGMDNAIFNPNYLALAPGIGVAFIGGGFTAQGEATLIQGFRVRGEMASPNAGITNFTMGLHLGYFILPQLSLGGEIRHQRFLSTPAPVKKDEDPAMTPPAKASGLRDTTTFAIGPRLHFKFGEKGWIRPGVAYARGIDDPLAKASYNMLQVDVPVAF